MRYLFLLLFCFTANLLFAQVPKISVVEHFTNSSCSICASTNPTIYGVLQNNPSVLHLSVFPSSPYSNCFFSLQNPIENDARTNYYGIYGATPKLVVNGSFINTSNLAAQLQAASTELSNYSIHTQQTFYTADSVLVNVVIKKVAIDSTQSATLFVAAFQDTVLQTTNNGESAHYDVFRKALTASSGQVVTLPVNVNDSITFNYAYSIPSTWIATGMHSIAILQQTISKHVIQADLSSNITSIPSGVKHTDAPSMLVYPNPVLNNLYLQNNVDFAHYTIRTLGGSIAQRGKIIGSTLDVSELPHGFYLLQLFNSKNSQTVKFRK